MLGRLILLVTFMAGFLSPSLPSQYTLPVSVPLRFDLPGSYIDVRRTTGGNTTQIVDAVHEGDEVSEVGRLEEEKGVGKRKRKVRHRIVLDENEEYDSFLENQGESKHVSRWSKKRRRNRFKKRGNHTSGYFPKKKNGPNVRRGNIKGRKSNPINRKLNPINRKSDPINRKSNPVNRKSHAPNRPSGGTPAGGRYRSVDPRQKKIQRHILRFHNILRSQVEPSAADMLAVGWYETAAEQAQAWAEQCGAHTEPDHPSVRWTSRYGACGQNVLVAPRKRRWSYVLRRWWSGRRFFRFGDDSNNSSVISAYTQMAWYNSHQLGCGFAECSTTGGSTFFRYVCNYCPSGNDPRRMSRPYTRGQTCRRCPNSCRSMCARNQCKLCTNACTYSDLWVNCATLDKKWHEWLCNTKTSQGVERFKNCRATCQCMKHIT